MKVFETRKAITLQATKIFAIILLCTMGAQQAQAQVPGDESYYHEWCTRVVGNLRSAIGVGDQAQTDAGENQILNSAIDQALNAANPRQRRYFNHTLVMAKEDQLIYNGDASRQVGFLKAYIENAIADLEYIDREQMNLNDATSYSALILERAQEWAIRAVTDKLEILILKRGMERALQFLAGSDYRRLPSNACASKIMNDAINTTAGLSEHDKVLVLRAGAENAKNSINNGCNY